MRMNSTKKKTQNKKPIAVIVVRMIPPQIAIDVTVTVDLCSEVPMPKQRLAANFSKDGVGGVGESVGDCVGVGVGGSVGDGV